MTDRAQIAGNQQNASGVNDFVEIVKTVAYALLIALFLRVLLFQPFTIPSASMEPTLKAMPGATPSREPRLTTMRSSLASMTEPSQGMASSCLERKSTA